LPQVVIILLFFGQLLLNSADDALEPASFSPELEKVLGPLLLLLGPIRSRSLQRAILLSQSPQLIVQQVDSLVLLVGMQLILELFVGILKEGHLLG
jgi:hypothetical protein